MFLAGAKNLENKKEWINELNVFPVPDGDTGNQYDTMTIMSAARECRHWARMRDMAALCKAISGPVPCVVPEVTPVLSCPSCSGGFTKRTKGQYRPGIPVLTCHLIKRWRPPHTKAVMKPKEGTILTVARGASL